MSATATATDWRETYTALARQVTADAGRAHTVLTGTSACVDGLWRVEARLLATMAQAAASTGAADEEAARGRELLTEILSRVDAARGGELVVHWPGGFRWFEALLGPPCRYQLGGTGPQVSWALATVGADSVLALADRSAEQLAVLDPRTGLCQSGTVVPAGSVAASGRPAKQPHCVLEFTAGTRYGERAVLRSTRVIVRFGDEPIERDEDFAALTPRLPGVRAGLLSGLNGPPDGDSAARDWLTGLGRAWAQAGIPVIHHELAEFSSTERLREALGLSVATSVGLSLSELYSLSARRGDPRLLARDVAERTGARRVVVHADDWALAVHRSQATDPARALLVGSLLAGARARAGHPVAELSPSPDAEFTADRPADGPIGDGWRAISVPSPHLHKPAATVGLGDTFVAGLLLAESLP
jgi:ADP-dependent phosphofructokinase/glucokinase